MGRRTDIDWEAIERDFRAGQLTIRQMADLHKVSPSAITRKADALGWRRNLTEEVKARTAAKLVEAADGAPATQSNTQRAQTPESAQRTQSVALPPTDAVERAATANVAVILRHREDLARMRGLFLALTGELEAGTTPDGQDLIAQMALAAKPADDETEDDARRRHALASRALGKVLTGPTRIDSAKKLTEMLERLIRMERDSFGIASNSPGDPAERIADAMEDGLQQLKDRFKAKLGARA
jgi:hypothetical protein